MKPEKTKAKEDFLKAIKDAYPSLSAILTAYENLTPEDNNETSAGFPFGMSYDEWLMEYRDWAEEVNKRFFRSEEHTSESSHVSESRMPSSA